MKKGKHIASVICLVLVLVSVPGNNTSCPVAAKTAAPEINKEKITVKKGKTKNLIVKGTSKKVSWQSSNKKIASVSSKGIVTGKKKGTATITAKVDGKCFQCKVTVINKNDYSPSLTAWKIKKTLGVPSRAKVTIQYGKKFYKESFEATLVPVTVFENGKKVAGASFILKNGTPGCNIANYYKYY